MSDFLETTFRFSHLLIRGFIEGLIPKYDVLVLVLLNVSLYCAKWQYTGCFVQRLSFKTLPLIPSPSLPSSPLLPCRLPSLNDDALTEGSNMTIP